MSFNAGPSLTQIRQFLAQEAGPYFAGTTTSGTTTVSVEDTTWPVTSSLNQASLFQDMFMYMPSLATATDRVRIVATYTPDPLKGTLTPDRAYGTNPGNGVAYELHGVFEPGTVVPKLINDGLKNCMIPVEFTFSPAANINTRHPLNVAAPWLTDPSWVAQVGVLAAGSQGRNVDDPYATRVRGDAYIDGDTVYLHTGAFLTTDTVYVRALKPAYYHCASTGGTVQNGLSLETDVVSVECPIEWVAYAALVEGWRQYSQVLDAKDNLKVSRSEAAAMFNYFDPHYGELWNRTFLPMGHWGPASRVLPRMAGQYVR